MAKSTARTSTITWVGVWTQTRPSPSLEAEPSLMLAEGWGWGGGRGFPRPSKAVPAGVGREVEDAGSRCDWKQSAMSHHRLPCGPPTCPPELPPISSLGKHFPPNPRIPSDFPKPPENQQEWEGIAIFWHVNQVQSVSLSSPPQGHFPGSRLLIPNCSLRAKTCVSLVRGGQVHLLHVDTLFSRTIWQRAFKQEPPQTHTTKTNTEG